MDRNSQVYFISGANRGIGLSLVQQFQDKGIVFATARVPEKAKELNELAKENKNIRVIKLDVTSKESTMQAAAEVAKLTDRVDVLVANAGISQSYRPINEIDEEDLDKHFKTNVYGAVYTFQAIYPFLNKSPRKEVAFISSLAGSVQGFFPIRTGSYGPSKAALNHFIRQIHMELKDDGFTIVAIHPGMVESDMGKYGLEVFKKDNVDMSLLPTITPEESASKIAAVLNRLDELNNGKFLSYEGEELSW